MQQAVQGGLIVSTVEKKTATDSTLPSRVRQHPMQASMCMMIHCQWHENKILPCKP